MILYHYTSAAGLAGILGSGRINPSTAARNPNDVRYGDGQYLSDVVPGTMSASKLSRVFLGYPFQGRRFAHYLAIDVEGLDVLEGRDHVFVVRNDRPLDVGGRLVEHGIVVPPRLNQ